MFGLLTKTKKITTRELQSKIDNNERINLIDVREKFEYKAGHIPTAKNVPMSSILGNPDQHLKNDKSYFIVCQSGGRSSRVVKQLSKLGYDVTNVAGGTMSYSGRLEK